MKRNIIITIFFLVLLGVLITAGSLFSTKKEITPVPTLPSIVPDNPSVVNTQSFQLIDTFPKEDVSTTYLPIREIAFTFNKPVSVENFYYSISPLTEASPRQGGNPSVVIFSPSEAWQEGTTTITIFSKTKSTDGKSLPQDYVFKINTAFPKHTNNDPDY